MLFGPEEFHSLAQADVQYSDLSTATWAQGNRDIHYAYDDNGSVIEKITAIKDEPDSQNNFEEKVTQTYNLQNRLAKVTTEDENGDQHIVEYVYNDEGIRVKSYSYDIPYGQGVQNEKTIVYLVDSYNHTSYAQTLEEKTYNGIDTSGAPDSLTTYLIGDDVIAQTVDGDTQYLLYDGHGSTRQLAEYDTSVTIADSYSYDGYGVLLQDDVIASANPGKVSPQQTNLLYAGEHFDTDAQQYYLRARWYNPSNGLFNRVDPYSGNTEDPQSLHKYLYCHANPINNVDPSGLMTLMEKLAVVGIIANVIAIFLDARWLAAAVREGDDFQIALAKIWLGIDIILLFIPFSGGARISFSGISISISIAEVTLLRVAVALYRASSTIRDFNIDSYGNQPSPRPGNTEAHHGMLDKWMEENVPGYNKNKAPTILIEKTSHHKTRTLYNNWKKAMRAKMGGKFQWTKVSYNDIKGLSHQMLDAAKVPQNIQKEFWEAFDKYYQSLK